MLNKTNVRTKIVTVPASKLKIHPIAQREIVPSKLKELTENLDLGAIGVLAAVEYKRHGKENMWIVDGQHRLLAIMGRAEREQFPDLKDWPVSVEIHIGVQDDAGACDLFLKLNSRAAVRCFDKFTKKLHRKDPDAVGISKLCSDLDLRISSGRQDGAIACVIQLQDAWQLDDGRSLTKALSGAIESWGRKAEAVDGKIIWALSAFHHRYNGLADQPSLQKKLAKYPGGPARLLSNARGFAVPGNSSIRRCVLQHIVDLYNQGRHSGRLERP